MLRGLTAKQLTEWSVYAAMTPFGEQRADWRAAQIAYLTYAVNADAQHQRPMTDFLLKFSEDPAEPAKLKTQTWQQQKSIMYAIAQSWSATGVKDL